MLGKGALEAPAIEVGTSLPAERVIRSLEQLRDWRGLPQVICGGVGPESTAQALVDWCREHRMGLRYIRPSKPNKSSQNAYNEPFNTTGRTEVLDAHLFDELDQAREITETGCSATTGNARMRHTAACYQVLSANTASGQLHLYNRVPDGGGDGSAT